MDFSAEPVDIGIRFGHGSYPGLAATKLADDALVVVAAPVVARKHAGWQLAHLAHETLLHDDHPDAWGSWFSSAARPAPKRLRLTQLTDSSMLVEAALRGQGVALARWSLCADELEVGRLVPLFPKRPPLRTGLAYYVVGLRERLRSGPAASFRDWLVKETQHLRQLGESRS